MRTWIGVMWAAGLAGCATGGDTIESREQAVVANASDVDDLGIDEAGCADAREDGGTGVAVRGRPDLVGVVVDGSVVCVTNVEFASSAGLLDAWWADIRTQPVPMSDGEPEPDPYSANEDDGSSGGGEEEPEPDPYRGDEGHDGEKSSDSPDSQ